MLTRIDGRLYEGFPGETIMELAKRNNIEIPHLCHKKGFEGLGRCRLCLVEVDEGRGKKIVSACVYPIKSEVEINTLSDRIIKMRRDIIFLLLLRSPDNEYIKNLAAEYHVKVVERYKNKEKEDCILCGLCVKACEKLGTNAISLVNRGTRKKVSTPFDDASLDCIGCGACAEVCPTDAIKMTEEKGIRKIWNREFYLVQCQVCGKYYTTEDALKYSASMLESQEEHICDYCKKKAMAGRFKEAFKNIY